MSIRIMSDVWLADLGTTEKIVLLVIADHASDDGGNAWPSQATIARKASLSIRTVQRVINDLEEAGWLWKDRHAGGSENCRDDRRPHLYTISLAKLRGDKATGRQNVRGDIDDVDGATLTTVTGRHTRPKNHTNKPPLDTSSDFDNFWKLYPRKTAKGAAKSAYLKALTKAEAETIYLGAERFANDPNRDPAFTPHASTWLNQERWLDEPLPPRRLTVEETKARELALARERDLKAREASRKVEEEQEKARARAVPMPKELRELLKRV